MFVDKTSTKSNELRRSGIGFVPTELHLIFVKYAATIGFRNSHGRDWGNIEPLANLNTAPLGAACL